MLSSPGTGLSLWAGVAEVFDDDAEDHKEDDDMAPIVVCLSSYCFGVPFFAWLFSSMIMVPSIKMVPFTLAICSETYQLIPEKVLCLQIVFKDLST